MQNNSSSNNTDSKTSFGYHDGEVETVISVDDVNRQAQQLAETISLEKISGLVEGDPFLKIEDLNAGRSEERRVGKECRSRWSPYH